MDVIFSAALTHAVATVAMTGLIWFVQIVHYPLFARVGETAFADYEHHHARLTTLVVGPLMLLEALTAVALIVMMPAQPAVWLGGGLLFLIWTSTLFLQVPQHRSLARGFDAVAYRRLVHSNWLRTVAWSARSVVALNILTLAIYNPGA